jgi:4-amino-4-deoxy-L-arabinose transferase-like glycosyltransferase
MNDPALRRPAAGLALVVAVAAAIRLAGLGHGLPQRIDPDENFATFGAWEMLEARSARPPSFIWPSAIFYALAGQFAVLRAAGYADFLLEPTAALLAARAFAAACGTLAVAAAGYAAWRLAGPWAGVGAAAIAALLPTLVETSKIPTTDALVTLLSTLGLAACARMADSPGHQAPDQVRARRRRYVAAGALAGLAAGAKYNGAFLLAPLFAAHVAVCWRNRRPAAAIVASSDLAVALGAAAAAFVATTPYAVVEPGRFLAGLAEQAAVFRSEYGLHGVGEALAAGPADAALAYAAALITELKVIFIFSCVGVGWWLLGGSRADRPGPAGRVWAVGIVAFLAMMASQPRASPKYVAPILPALAVVAASTAALPRGRAARAAAAIALAVGIAHVGATRTAPVIAAWRAPDTREAARAWLVENVPPGETVATDAWHYTVDLAPYRGVPKARFRVLPYIALADRGLDGLRADGATWIVTSSIVEGQHPNRAFYADLAGADGVYGVVVRFDGRRVGVLNPTLTIRRLRAID